MSYRIHRHPRRAIAALSIAAVVLASCGGDDKASGTVAPPATDSAATQAPATASRATTPATTGAPAAAGPLVSLADTSLGKVIVAADGMTLYSFKPDSAGTPTCTGGCAGNWPAYFVPDGTELTAGPGLDASLLSVVAHPDGGTMLKYGDWPLYYFAGDQAPGDVNGQDVNDVWYAIDATGTPLEGGSESATESAVLVSVADTSLGAVVVGADGMTLYAFDPDSAGTPTCAGGCAANWPPLLVDDGAELTAGDGIDAALLSVVPHPDGGNQLKLGDWPLYSFAGDNAPGDVNGQGVNDVWWAVDATGAPLK
jgi:predicted lipoprotein with Yx(FWY)xxD motif